jgi:hypothetical protein
VHILPFDTSIQLTNHPPEFVTELPPIVTTVAQTGKFDLGLKLPQVSDLDGDKVSMTIDFGSLTSFIVFN